MSEEEEKSSFDDDTSKSTKTPNTENDESFETPTVSLIAAQCLKLYHKQYNLTMKRTMS